MLDFQNIMYILPKFLGHFFSLLVFYQLLFPSFPDWSRKQSTGPTIRLEGTFLEVSEYAFFFPSAFVHTVKSLGHLAVQVHLCIYKFKGKMLTASIAW